MNELRTAAFRINVRSNDAWGGSVLSARGVEVHVKGFAFRHGSLFGQDSLASLFARALDDAADAAYADRLLELLAELNGTFAVVLCDDRWLFAAVDRVRSFPLFYGTRNVTVCLSDDAGWIRAQVGDVEPCRVSVNEFILTGYVTGSDTLFPNVKQLQAGECLWCTAAGGRPQVTTYRYYRWIHGDVFDATEEELCREMDRMHLQVFERLLNSTRDRTLVVPLSGGYDSRLIVTMLKRLGRHDVICFSYGRPGNKEAEISKCVADRLGYPWTFVPYSRRKWRDWFHSDEWRLYAQYACGLCTVPHIQDWPAVWMLRDEGCVPDNAVFVPGHTAMLATQANKVHQLMEYTRLEGLDLLVTAIRDSHYTLWRSGQKFLRTTLSEKLSCVFGCDPYATADELASALDLWAWQERHAKFIINSIRSYEFWGYEWRIPLWDNDMLAFWRRVPLTLRVQKDLYRKYMRGLLEAGGPDIGETAHAGSATWIGLLRIRDLKHCPWLRPMAEAIYARIKWLRSYWCDPMEWHGTHPWKEHVKMAVFRRPGLTLSSNINSFLALKALEELGTPVATLHSSLPSR